MLRKYNREDNSEKYARHGLERDKECFDMGIADMDVGVYEPLHAKIMGVLAGMQGELIRGSGDGEKGAVREQYLNRARQSIIRWYKTEYNCSLRLPSDPTDKSTPVHISFCTSIVTLCSYSILALTESTDSILIMTPVYASYASIITALGRKPVATELSFREGEGQGMGKFEIDFGAMEQVIKDKKVRLLLLCHPHNPSGRVWMAGEVQAIVELCRKYGVIIVSDQILSDLNLSPTPFCSLAHSFPVYPRILVTNSISKSFNYSSLQAGYCFTPDPELTRKLAFTIDVYGQAIDDLAVCTVIACLGQQGRDWLGLIKGVVLGNYRKLLTWSGSGMGKLKVARLDAAYIVYLDLTAYFKDIQQMRQALQSHNIHVIELGSNYLPAKPKTLQIRVCIACEEDRFTRFLQQLELAIKGSPQPKL